MPGGKIAVYTGIMPVAKNEAGLAAILGHEVAHVTLDHGKERYAQAVKGNIAGAVIGVATAVGGQALCKTQACKMLTGLGGAAAGFAITFFDRKFSREAETEADKTGLAYMAQAGYEPSEAVGVWERMHEATKGAQPPEFLSTHPAPTTRQENIKGWLPEVKEEYSKAEKKYGVGENI
jgi:predicted Zn-dependent protease